MTNGLRVYIEGLDMVRREVSHDNFAKAVAAIRLGVANEVRAEIAAYPGEPKYPLSWKSKKQRRWFFMSVKAGFIKVPYVRQLASTSQRLGPSWTVADEGRTVGTRVTYAPYVQSHKYQQPFHKDTGWTTDKQAVEEVAGSGIIDNVAREVLRKALDRRRRA